MVVGDFRGVEHFFRFFQRFSTERPHEVCVGCHAREFRLIEAVHRLRTLRIDIVREVAGIDARIGRNLLFVERLDDVERGFCRKTEFLVAFHLQRGKVVELRRGFRAFFLLDACHRKWFALNQLEGLFALFFRGEFSFRSRENGVAIRCRQHPIGLGLEILDFLLAVHDERERGRLHATYAQHLPVLAVFQRVEARGVHAEQPVANGAAQSGEIERLVFVLTFQFGETLADGLVGHRRNPQSLHGAFRARFLHHPALNQFTLLAGVATVNDAVGLLHEPFDDGKLLLDAVVVDEFDAEARRQHRKRTQRPAFPLFGVVVRLLQRTQVAEGPRHLIAVALHVFLVVGCGADDSRDVATYAGFLCDANNHTSYLLR